jgi:hypothetical protein
MQKWVMMIMPVSMNYFYTILVIVHHDLQYRYHQQRLHLTKLMTVQVRTPVLIHINVIRSYGPSA